MSDKPLELRVTEAVREHLLPAAPPNLRAILASCNERRIRLACYIEGYVDEDMRTAIHHAGSSLMDAFLGERRVFIEVQQLDPGAAVPEPRAGEFTIPPS